MTVDPHRIGQSPELQKIDLVPLNDPSHWSILHNPFDSSPSNSTAVNRGNFK